jgi:hypothetical protein
VDLICLLKVAEGALVGYIFGELGVWAICWIISNTDSFPNLDSKRVKEKLNGVPVAVGLIGAAQMAFRFCS